MTKHLCTAEHSHSRASRWVQRYLPTLADGSVSAPVLLDWACGQGRHSLLALDRGWQVLA
ncbi:MAG: hypothetical protein RLY65_1436, partial [Pseudomonadota bacterium]